MAFDRDFNRRASPGGAMARKSKPRHTTLYVGGLQTLAGVSLNAAVLSCLMRYLGMENFTPREAVCTAYQGAAVCMPSASIADELGVNATQVQKAIERLKRGYSVALPSGYAPSYLDPTYGDGVLTPYEEDGGRVHEFPGGYALPLLEPFPGQRGARGHSGVYLIHAPNADIPPRKVYRAQAADVAAWIREGCEPNPFAAENQGIATL